VSTSRINGDFVYFIFHHLRHRGYECLQAPYFAGAQLAHFAEQNVVQTIFGPPGLLLYGVKSCVIHLNFGQQTFDWVDLDSVLQKWQLTWDEFVDACMLAGTEYCLTYPYLNLSHFQPQQQARFNFDAAVYIIKQAPLINWMQTFPTEDMKNDHVDGYCICKVLVQNSPVYHLGDVAVRPLGAKSNPTGAPPQVPSDFSAIMGNKLPPSLYYLMLNGIISHKLPQALAKGEWTDKSQPLVDTSQFRELLNDLQEYRRVALGLIAQHLHHTFQTKRILCKAYWEPNSIRQAHS
ncbi:Post-transcriptional regulator mkt1 (Inactive endonuclease mkt1) (Post-transcriptional RNA stability regulator mkt1), partial [Durusdinium trenchii]